jgi:hypothetical protein
LTDPPAEPILTEVLSPRHLLALAGVCAFTIWFGFVACATDPGLDTPKGGKKDASGDGSGGGGGIPSGDAWPQGGFGSPCTVQTDCIEGKCVDTGQGKPKLTCVLPCKTTGNACPNGAYCTFHPDEGYICVPDVGNQCSKCISDADCPSTGDKCVPSPKIDRFCARDCSYDSQCPAGNVCVAVGDYPPDAGASAPDGGSVGDAGSPTKPLKMCVPSGNESCPCNAKRDGVKRVCTSTSGSVVCEGTETCNGSTSKWEDCSASTPKPEICDGADNDCNGTKDDGTPAALCGTAPPHATWTCNVGVCEVEACEDGWSQFPPGNPSAGCTCQTDTGEPNDTCATPKASGSVSDANTTALTLSGHLSSSSDVDWFQFDTVDSDEGTTNSYHIKIVFSAPATNNEFIFDVVRGAVCGTPDAKHSDLTSYDWCVDGTGTVGGNTVGESSCGPTAPIHCGPHGKPYFIRVKRKPGATPTCDEYKLTVTAKGGGSCDFTQACDTQIDEGP